MTNTLTALGPFSQILTMDSLPDQGAIKDSQLQIIPNGGIVVKDGIIQNIAPYESLRQLGTHDLPAKGVVLPGFIDAHTHICFAGSRAHDYAQRLQGVSYQEISSRGGGILDTVTKTREATKKELIAAMIPRLNRCLSLGVTTCEVKSGYGLTLIDELKMLEAIQEANQQHPVDLIPTCLAAHVKPPEFSTHQQYLQHLVDDLFPKLQGLAKRVDIFIEHNAFSASDAYDYLIQAKQQGFSVCIHADQFTRGGSQLAGEIGAISADHLEVSTLDDLKILVENQVSAITLPGCSLGLGVPYAPVRNMLDAGLSVAIASDWNPGSAPMGNLLTQASLLGAAQHLTMAETFAGMTYRAAKALGLYDRGILKKGMRADLILFPCQNYQEILYHQGSLLPSKTYIKGKVY